MPISYVFDGERICFHSAQNGYKIDTENRSPKASFCIIDQDRVVPEEYTTYFRSVIVFGRIRILREEREKYAAIEKLAAKDMPDGAEEDRCSVIMREWRLYVCWN